MYSLVKQLLHTCVHLSIYSSCLMIVLHNKNSKINYYFLLDKLNVFYITRWNSCLWCYKLPSCVEMLVHEGFLLWSTLVSIGALRINHLLMLTYFCVENVPEFQYCFWLFTDVDYFSCVKCSYHSWLIFMWFSFTQTYPSMAHTSFSLVIYWSWHIFVWKMFQNFNIVFDYLLMLTIFHV